MILALENISHSYRQGGKEIAVLSNFNLEIEKGKSVALVGESGAGKSTLLHITGLLEQPTSGTVTINGKIPKTETQRTQCRAKDLGFVYQAHRLLPDFSALENVMLPQQLQGHKNIKQRAKDLLAALKVDHRANHRPMMLSGGEQQRVAIARALIHQPKILIADEPTGNLDPATANTVFSLLENIVAERSLSLLMATHNHGLAKRLNHVVTL